MAIISRSDNAYAAPDGSKSGLIPASYSKQIIQAAVENSLALGTFRRVTMPAGVSHLPVLDALPVAKWVTGEPNSAGAGGMKATAEQKWKGVVLTAEEIAAIVVIPEAVLEDSSVDLWPEITPRLGESIGYAVDAACFFGTDKPASWPNDIHTAAIAAGNEVEIATPDEASWNTALGMVETDGYLAEQVYAATDQKSVFRGMTNYLSEIRGDGRVDSIYGVPIKYDRMGALGSTTHGFVGDPSFALLGVRTDLQYKLLEEATIDISAAQDGSAMVSLAQQDSVALRVRARFAFAVANPVNRLQPVEADRYPFAVVKEVTV